MDVYVIDSRLQWTWWSYSQDMPDPKHTFKVDERWSMHRIAHRIAQYAPVGINCLRLCCHGDIQGGGQVNLGMGLDPQTAREFQFLRNRFVDNARIEVHACAILSSTPIVVRSRDRWILPDAVVSTSPGTFDPNGQGARTMRALCIATQQIVRAAINAQQPDANFRFEGPVGTFSPPFGWVMIGHIH